MEKEGWGCSPGRVAALGRCGSEPCGGGREGWVESMFQNWVEHPVCPWWRGLAGTGRGPSAALGRAELACLRGLGAARARRERCGDSCAVAYPVLEVLGEVAGGWGGLGWVCKKKLNTSPS